MSNISLLEIGSPCFRLQIKTKNHTVKNESIKKKTKKIKQQQKPTNKQKKNQKETKKKPE